MDLIDSLREAKEVGRRHKIDNVLAGLPEATRHALKEALADRLMTHVAISRALKAAGFDVSPTSVRRYRSDVLGWK